MGRQEYLTAMALGRGHYEDEIIQTAGEGSQNQRTQEYNDRGHPRNPETKRREREHVRAANEVMQVTGVVEDVMAVREKATQTIFEKHQELVLGLRFMEVGRAVLVGGVWGVMGLRRRVLLYKPYTGMRFVDILRQERAVSGIPHMFLSGVPTVIAYHISDWAAFFIESVIDAYFDDDNIYINEGEERMSIFLHNCFTLVPQFEVIYPVLILLAPYDATSTFDDPFFDPRLAHGKIKYAVSRIIYSPIYKSLPRPTGESVFSGLTISAPTMEYDSPDRVQERPFYTSDEPTLRALEGLPTLDRQHRDESSDEDEMAHATLISFDVEATEPVENATGTWSAELRSANEPKPSEDVKYRVTGLTMLPTFMATEGLREILASIVVMPLEAVMVRFIGRAYRASAGLPMDDIYPTRFVVRGVQNILSVLTMQLVVTGVTWAGFTIGTQYWAARKRAMLANRAADAAESRSN
ncbi:hypothetical protein IFR05_010131 [Cadophora sp. M221]|nr:hypothetical protein IFR05_010131 [Cadophora sp. M221]